VQRIHTDRLRTASIAALTRLGTPPDLAEIVAHSLIEANLVGHDSHGVMRLTQYADMVKRGQIRPAERHEAATLHRAAARVDGHWGWGQPAALAATELCIGMARQQGMAAVTVTNCNHVGRLGEYVEMAARQGLIGLAFCNSGPTVAPHGGRTRLLGTNPIACAVPRAGGDPVLIDMATSGTAEGKLRVARDKGESIGPGLILDKHGMPSQDPGAFYEGGVMLSMSGHKGYGLAVMIDLLAGALSGTGPTSSPQYGGGNGTLMLVFDPACFGDGDAFAAHVEQLHQTLSHAPTAPGFERVLVPGEPEWRTRARRTVEGVDLPETTWSAIRELAGETV